jgi:TPP-dependent pyruvate/acetoin dehydrogenase alpha subunit
MRYRTAEEMAEWEARCPILRFEAWLLEKGVATEADLATVVNEITAEIAAAVEYAVNSPFPSPEEGKTDVYSDSYAYVVDPQLQQESPIGGLR